LAAGERDGTDSNEPQRDFAVLREIIARLEGKAASQMAKSEEAKTNMPTGAGLNHC